MNRTLQFLILTALCGCGSSSPSGPSPSAPPSLQPLSQPFELRVGQEASVEGDVRVIFSEVLSDSRCPMNAFCVAKGEVTVRVIVYYRDAPTSTRVPGLSLPLSGTIVSGTSTCSSKPGGIECVVHTPSGQVTIRTPEYTVALVQLMPYPRSAQPIKPADYVATFSVTPR
jgi:hypothetical protein